MSHSIKIIKLIVFNLLFLILTGCPEPGPFHDSFVMIKNNSDNDIIWYSYSTNPYDTTLLKESPWNNFSGALLISQSSTKEYLDSVGMINAFESGWWKHFYIFNYDSIRTIPWQRIRDEYIVAKRVDINSWEQLEDANFTISYP